MNIKNQQLKKQKEHPPILRIAQNPIALPSNFKDPVVKAEEGVPQSNKRVKKQQHCLPPLTRHIHQSSQIVQKQLPSDKSGGDSDDISSQIEEVPQNQQFRCIPGIYNIKPSILLLRYQPETNPNKKIVIPAEGSYSNGSWIYPVHKSTKENAGGRRQFVISKKQILGDLQVVDKIVVSKNSVRLGNNEYFFVM